MTDEIDRRKRLADRLDGTREVRSFHADLELREAGDGMLRFSGYASVTEHPYEVGDFTEVIAKNSFRRTLTEDPDCSLLLNHTGLPLARTKSGTMRLSEDERGLLVSADLDPDDPDVRALVPKLRRGDVSEMSIGFRVTDQVWSEDRSKRTIRGLTLHKGDCSLVTYGANDATSAQLVARQAAALAAARKPLPDHTTRAKRRVLELMAQEARANLAATPKRTLSAAARVADAGKTDHWRRRLEELRRSA